MLLYNTLNPSVSANAEGLSYIDPFSINLNDFAPEKPVSSYALTEMDIARFDILIYDIYKSSYYEKLILLLNSIDDLHSMKVGDIIYLWEVSDMKAFLISQSKETT